MARGCGGDTPLVPQMPEVSVGPGADRLAWRRTGGIRPWKGKVLVKRIYVTACNVIFEYSWGPCLVCTWPRTCSKCVV